MVNGAEEGRYTAFKGAKQIAQGGLDEVRAKLQSLVSGNHFDGVLIFDDDSGQQIDIDMRSAVTSGPVVAESVATAPGPTAVSAPGVEAERGRGRPKLGVVSREVTLLPRHWDWLNSQPGGASVALRKLVDEARRSRASIDVIRKAQDSAYKFMSAIGGNFDGFEEAIRALFARDKVQFETAIQSWPVDIRRHALKLATETWHVN